MRAMSCCAESDCTTRIGSTAAASSKRHAVWDVGKAGGKPGAGGAGAAARGEQEAQGQERQAGKRARQDEDRAGYRGKSTRAAGGHLRQRGFRRELNEAIDAHFPALEEAIGVTPACRVLGRARSTLHRRLTPRPPAASAERTEFHHPAELAVEEKRRVLQARGASQPNCSWLALAELSASDECSRSAGGSQLLGWRASGQGVKARGRTLESAYGALAPP